MTSILLMAILGCVCPCVTLGAEADRARAFDDAEWVLQGRVAAATVTAWAEGGISRTATSLVPSTIEYRIQVQRLWKGEHTDELTVEASGQPTSCGAALELGQYYVLYLQRIDGKAILYSCTRRLLVVGSYSERQWLDSKK
jgi:hypothetical protein